MSALSRLSAVLGLSLVTLLSCGGEAKKALPPVVEEGPDDEILRIGAVWESRSEASVFQTEPSPFAHTVETTVSVITLKRGEDTATETIEVNQKYKLRAGGEVTCTGNTEATVALAYGRRSTGEAAVQITRGEVEIPRTCKPAGVLGAVQLVPQLVGRFQLRGDRLSGFEPAAEKRAFIPID